LTQLSMPPSIKEEDYAHFSELNNRKISG